MSCEKCEEIQRLNLNREHLYYLRVENANVLIGACEKHFKMLRDKWVNKQ